MSDLACPSCGATSGVYGVEIRGAYDGVLYWSCSYCAHAWHRWGEGHPLRARAEKYLPKSASARASTTTEGDER